MIAYVTVNEVGAIHGLLSLFDFEMGKLTISEYYNNKKDGLETEYTFNTSGPIDEFLTVTNRRYVDGDEIESEELDELNYGDIYWLQCPLF